MSRKLVKINADVVYGRGGRIFVISDLHGNANDFNRWLESVGFTSADYCIVNGDAIDRGPDGIALLLHFMQNTNNYLFLMGNHEELMLGAIKEAGNGSINRFYQDNWFANGGNPTCEAFCSCSSVVQDKIVSFLENAPYVGEIVSNSYETIYVAHAGLNYQWLCEVYNDRLSLDKHNLPNITWAREEWWYSPHDLDGMLVTGHTSTSSFGGVRGEVLYDNYRRIVIDCNTINTHKVGYVRVSPDSLVYGSN